MSEQYSESLVMRKIAESIGTYVKAISDKLSYAKGHRGTIVADKGDYYIVQINGVEHKLRSKWQFQVGQSVIVFSLQNNMNDLVVIPTLKDFGSLIKKIILEPSTSLPYLTVAPTSENPDGGLKIVILHEEPMIKYNGYLYFIEED